MALAAWIAPSWTQFVLHSTEYALDESGLPRSNALHCLKESDRIDARVASQNPTAAPWELSALRQPVEAARIKQIAYRRRHVILLRLLPRIREAMTSNQLQFRGTNGSGERVVLSPDLAAVARIDLDQSKVWIDRGPEWFGVTAEMSSQTEASPQQDHGHDARPVKGVGRPGVADTAQRLFKQRREEGKLPLSKQIDEAREILGIWPHGQEAPQDKTVSQHISKLWHDARRAINPSDKL